MKRFGFILLSICSIALFFQSTSGLALPEDEDYSGDDLFAQEAPEAPLAQANIKNDDNNASIAAASARGSGGSNLVSFGVPCATDGLGSVCNELQELICDSSGICKCKENILQPDAPLVWGVSVTKCIPIATEINSWSCSDHSQCTATKYGKYSRCSDEDKCECFDVDNQRRDVFFVEGVCYIKKELDQSCKNDMECNATIIGEAVCLGSEVGTDKTGVCKCADAHEFEPNFRECLKLGTLHSDCKSDFQCQHVNALGPLSKCHEEKKVCDCWDTESHGAKKTAFHEGRCHFSRGANETCTEKIECVLGYHKNADCLPHPSYNGEKVCQCPPGVDCKSAGTTCSASLVPVIAAGLYVSHRYLFF